MKDTVQSSFGSWTSYFFSGSIALIVSWVLAVTFSGCRVGNFTDNSNNTNNQISGYYSTAPIKMTRAVLKSTGDQTIDVPLSQIPTGISNYFTDPSMLVLMDSSSGKLGILPPTTNSNSKYFPLYLDSQGKLGLTNQDDPLVAWQDPACQYITQLQILGNLSPLGSTPATMNSPIGQVPIKGRIQAEMTLVGAFQGSCTQTMTDMQTCYNDVTQCPQTSSNTQQDWQTLAQQTFDPYIQAGAMTASDIPNVQGVGFVIQYQ